jgi:hypothetical protein
MPAKRKLPTKYELPTDNLQDLKDYLADAQSALEYQLGLLGQKHAVERANLYSRMKQENDAQIAAIKASVTAPSEILERHKAELAELKAKQSAELAALDLPQQDVKSRLAQLATEYASRRAAEIHNQALVQRKEKKDKLAEMRKYVEYAETNVALREREISVQAAKDALNAKLAASRPAQLAEIARLEAKEAAEREAKEAEKSERAAARAARD